MNPTVKVILAVIIALVVAWLAFKLFGVLSALVWGLAKIIVIVVIVAAAFGVVMKLIR